MFENKLPDYLDRSLEIKRIELQTNEGPIKRESANSPLPGPSYPSLCVYMSARLSTLLVAIIDGTNLDQIDCKQIIN